MDFDAEFDQIFDDFEEKQYTVYKKGHKRLNCTISVIGETAAHEDSYIAHQLVVKLVSRHNTRVFVWPMEEITNIGAAQQVLRAMLKTPIVQSFTSLNEFQSYIHSKYDHFMKFNHPTENWKVTGHTGMQKDGILVISDLIQIDKNGRLLDESERYVLHHKSLAYCQAWNEIGSASLEIFKRLTNDIKVAYRYNSSAVFGAIAGYAYLMNYVNDITRGRNVPTIVLYSTDVDTGKTSSLNLIESLFNQTQHKRVSRISDAKFKTQAMATSFPLVMDDVVMSRELKNRIINVYTGCGESDATSSQAYKIRCGLMISSNFTVDDVERVSTKVLPIGYIGPSLTINTSPEQVTAFKGLLSLAESCSKYAVTQIPITCHKYNNLSAEDECHLRKKVEGIVEAHPRLVSGYCNLLFFMKEIFQLEVEECLEMIKDIFAPMKQKVPEFKRQSELDLLVDELAKCDETTASTFMTTGIYHGRKAYFLHRGSMPPDLQEKLDNVKQVQGLETTTRGKRKCYVVLGNPTTCKRLNYAVDLDYHVETETAKEIEGYCKLLESEIVQMDVCEAEIGEEITVLKAENKRSSRKKRKLCYK